MADTVLDLSFCCSSFQDKLKLSHLVFPKREKNDKKNKLPIAVFFYIYVHTKVTVVLFQCIHVQLVLQPVSSIHWPSFELGIGPGDFRRSPFNINYSVIWKHPLMQKYLFLELQ